MANTAYDVQREYMTIGAKLDGQFQFPVMPRYVFKRNYPKDTIDFSDSLSAKIKNWKELNVNFYIHDYQFERLWNNPDKYIDHLRCFHSVCAPDFTTATGENGFPFAVNIYNKHRNHALAWYLYLRGVEIIPSVGIQSKDCWDWCFDGFPKESVLAVSTNGRVKSKAARLEFCEGFKEMCDRLEPTSVVLVGHMPDELQTDVKILQFENRSMKKKKELSDGNSDGIRGKKEEPDAGTGTPYIEIEWR